MTETATSVVTRNETESASDGGGGCVFSTSYPSDVWHRGRDRGGDLACDAWASLVWRHRQKEEVWIAILRSLRLYRDFKVLNVVLVWFRRRRPGEPQEDLKDFGRREKSAALQCGLARTKLTCSRVACDSV